MNGPRLFIVVIIFVAASVAWLVLGETITVRTEVSEATLRHDVDRMFGPCLVQEAPSIVFAQPADADEVRFPPDASEIDVILDHEDRYRGLVWFSVYRVAFDATYTFAPSPEMTTAGTGRFQMALPDDANIDELRVAVGEDELAIDRTVVDVPVPFEPGRPTQIHVSYVTSGQDTWEYQPRTNEGGLRNFRLTACTNFEDIDYPATGLSPTKKAGPRTDGRPGIEAVWDYAQMIPARDHTIGIVMPSMPDSGVLSARISLFAPVSLFFFFVVMVVIQLLRRWKLHPMNYLLIAAGFFAFHILLAYLVDHLPIHVSFWIAAVVSVVLVVSYLGLVLGARIAIFVAGAAQLVYLVFFSYAFFWQGWTGLTVVIGAIVTLFVIMQLTGRIDWDERLAGPASRRSDGTATVTPSPPPTAPSG